jgi:hypothetical protein
MVQAQNDSELFILRDFLVAFIKEASSVRAAFRNVAKEYEEEISSLRAQLKGTQKPGLSPSKTSRDKSDKSDRGSTPTPNNKPGATKLTVPTGDELCGRCGRTGHQSDTCKYYNRKPTAHPDCNTSAKQWNSSEMGKLYKRLRPSAPYLQWSTRLDGNKAEFIPIEPTTTTPTATPTKSKGTKGTVLACCTDCKSTPKLDDVLLPASFRHRNQKEGLTAITLLDSGARALGELNLISRKVADKIVSKGGAQYARPMTVCAMFNVCKPYQNAIDLEVNLEFDKAKGDIQNIGLVTFQVVDTIPDTDVLIGWTTLKQRAVLCRCAPSLQHRAVAPIAHVLHISQLQRPHGVAYDVRDVDDEDNTDHESDSEPVPANQFQRRNFVCAIKVGGSRRKPGRTILAIY